MRYITEAFLQKIVDAQNITLDYKKKHGSTQVWIYENIIEQRYGISKSTYYQWLGRNAKAELRQLKNQNNENKAEKI
jgi:hypothetical protein